MRYFVLFLILFLSNSIFAYNLTPDGKNVFWSGGQGIINCTSVSTNILLQEQVCDITSRFPTQKFNVSFVFDRKIITPKNLFFWSNISHNETTIHYSKTNKSYIFSNIAEIQETSEECAFGLGSSKKKLVYLTENGSSMATIVCLNSYQNFGNGTINISYNSLEPYQETQENYYFDWVDISDLLKISKFDNLVAGSIDTIFQKDKTKRIKLVYSVPWGSSGKFDIYLHTGTIEDAKNTPSKIKILLDPWWNSSWTYRIPCLVNTTVAASLQNFPVHCILNTSALISAGKMNSSCKDLRVTNISGNALSYEIENNTCNTSSTVIWVKIPATNATGNDTLHLYYGNVNASDAQNASSVWSSYVSVYHFSDNTTLLDSAGTNHLAKIAYTTTPENTFWGKGVLLTGGAGGTNYYRNSSSIGVPAGQCGQAITIWTTYHNFGFTWDTNAYWGHSTYGIGSGYSVGVHADSINQIFNTRGGQGTGTPYNSGMPTVPGNTYFAASVYNGTHTLEYMNITSTSLNSTNQAYTTFMVGSTIAIGGDTWSGDGTANSTLTEVRFANVSRSTDWLTAEYAQTDLIGTEENAYENIIFSSQTPSDITSTNVMASTLNITYESIQPVINLTVHINASIFLNGSLIPNTTTYSNTSDFTHTFVLSDNSIYPASYNYNESIMENTTHSTYLLNTNSKYLKLEFLNISSVTNYTIFELMLKNTTPATSPITLYYCNSSYVSGSVLTSNFCTGFATYSANQNFNHSHIYGNSNHSVFVVPTSGGNINAVKMTSTSYVILRGVASGGWNIYYIPNISRTSAMQSSANNGNTYSDEALTIDAHFHQFSSNQGITYWAGNSTYNTTNRSDTYELDKLPPSSPVFVSPTNSKVIGILNISYSQSFTPTDNISFYNISLFYSNFTFIQTIASNNSLNLSYLWNTSNISESIEYIIGVNVTSTANLSTISYSNPFYVYNFSLVLNQPNYYETENITGTVSVFSCSAPLLFNLTFNNSNKPIVITCMPPSGNSKPYFFVAPLISINNTNFVIALNMADTDGSINTSVKVYQWYEKYNFIFSQLSNVLELANYITALRPDRPSNATRNISWGAYSFSLNSCYLFTNSSLTANNCSNTTLTTINISNYNITSHIQIPDALYSINEVNHSYSISYYDGSNTEATSSRISSFLENSSTNYYLQLTNRSISSNYSGILFNISFYEELTGLPTTADSGVASYIVGFADGATKSYVVPNQNNLSSFLTYVYPNFNNYTVIINSTESYTKAGYTTRNRFLLDSNISINTTYQADIYFLPINSSTYSVIYTTTNNLPAPNRLVQILKYYPSITGFILIGSVFTNNQGQAPFYADLTGFYKFIVYEGSTIVYTSSSPEQFVCISGNCQITINVATNQAGNWLTPYSAFNCYGNNSTNNIIFSYADYNGLTTSITYQAWRLNNYTGNNTLVCDYSINASSNTYACQLNNVTDNLNNFTYMCQISHTSSPEGIDLVKFLTPLTRTGLNDLMLAVIIIVLSVSVAGLFIHPAIGVGAGTISIFAVCVLGLLQIPIGAAISFVCVGMVITFLLLREDEG